MIAARKRFSIGLHPAVEREDLRGLHEAERPPLLRVLELIQARRDEADAKAGRLTGCLSASFADSGRVVYSVSDHAIFVWAIHSDHDEAYRRARARFRR